MQITESQIEAFHSEAAVAGDMDAVAVCETALYGEGRGERDAARSKVAGWIADAQAMRNDEAGQ